jgi:threonine/homoserine/homoserine lactone efflux protein
LQTSLGVLSGNLVHIGYCVVGIGWLISTSIVAFSVLKFAGAAYLVYLGITSFRAKEISLAASQKPANAPSRTWFLQGFINNVLNPKGALFYLGVFTMVITPDTSIATTVLLIGVMMVICAAFWLFFVSTLDHPSVRQFIERFQQAAGKVFGTVLIALGLRVALLER